MPLLQALSPVAPLLQLGESLLTPLPPLSPLKALGWSKTPPSPLSPVEEQPNPCGLPPELWLQIIQLVFLSSPHDSLFPLLQTSHFFRTLAQEVQYSHDTLTFDSAIPTLPAHNRSFFGPPFGEDLLLACSCPDTPSGVRLCPRGQACPVRSLLLGPLSNPSAVRHARRQPQELQSYAPTALSTRALALLATLSSLRSLSLKDTAFTLPLLATLEGLSHLRELELVGSIQCTDEALLAWTPRHRLSSLKVDNWALPASQELELLLSVLCTRWLKSFGWLRLTERIGLRTAAPVAGAGAGGGAVEAEVPGSSRGTRKESVLKVFGHVLPRDGLERLDLQFPQGLLSKGETFSQVVHFLRTQQALRHLTLFVKIKSLEPLFFPPPGEEGEEDAFLPLLESFEGPSWSTSILLGRKVKSLTIRDCWNGKHHHKLPLQLAELELLRPVGHLVDHLTLDVWSLPAALLRPLAQTFPNVRSLSLRLSLPAHHAAQDGHLFAHFGYPVFSLYSTLLELFPGLGKCMQFDYDWDWAPPAFPDCLFTSPSYQSALVATQHGAQPGEPGYTADPVIREYLWMVLALSKVSAELREVGLRGLGFERLAAGREKRVGREMGPEWGVWGWGDAVLARGRVVLD